MFEINAPILSLTLCLMLAGLWIWRRVRRARKPQNAIVLDGSNVMHWKDGTPSVDTLREVIAHLRDKGYEPGVVFDANAGYLLSDRFLSDRALARLLDLSLDRVMVVPKGTPADPTILTAARDMNCPVLTCDRYRDWADAFPEVENHGHLVRGGYRRGQLWIDV